MLTEVYPGSADTILHNVTFTHFVKPRLYNFQAGNTGSARLANYVLDWGIRNELEPNWLVGLADTLNLSQGVMLPLPVAREKIEQSEEQMLTRHCVGS